MSDAIDTGVMQPGTAPLSATDAQKIGEDMVRSGVPVEAVNSYLKERGVEPLDISPAVAASRELDRLKASPEWRERYARGDAAAEAEFNKLTFAISTGNTTVERTPDASDYYSHFRPHPVTTEQLGQVDGDKAVEQFYKEHAEWSAALALSPQAAGAINELVLDGSQRFNAMSEDQKINFAQEQSVTLTRILARDGQDPDARIKAAETILKNRGGRAVDINRIAKQAGAELALELVLQSERLGRK